MVSTLPISPKRDAIGSELVMTCKCLSASKRATAAAPPTPGGDDQGVVIPNAIFGDASAAENREIGVGLLERLFAQRADENPEAAVNTAAGDDGFHASDFAEEGRDRE